MSTDLHHRGIVHGHVVQAQTMSIDAFAPDFLIKRSECIALGINDTVLRRATRAGRLVRVIPGVYVDADVWSGLDDLDRHRTLVRATAERVSSSMVFSHFAAASRWDIRILGVWPNTVDVTLERATGGRSDGMLRRHCTGLESTETVELDGLTVTSPAQTVVDLARVLPFPDAVVAMDSALHRKRRPAPLTSIDEIERLVEQLAGKTGHRKAAAAAAFASSASDSPEESHSRVQIHLLGFPRPVLQRRFLLRNGGEAEVDFYWPDFDHIGECDGRVKYTDARYLRGRTSQQVVIDEKNRENELRRLVGRVSRWEPRELYPARQLYDRLTRDGLPSTKRRP